MKTVLITGIGRGIGKALADKFLAEGFFVIGTTYSSKPASATADAPNLKTYSLDLSSSDSIRKCADDIKKTGMKIDILINNAGIMPDVDEQVLMPDKLRATLEVNLIGTADLTERLIPAMNKGGHIVFISSQAGSLAGMDDLMASHHPYFYPAYKISKTALNMYARTLAVRMLHEKYAITVSCVHPGWVRTDMGGDEAPVSPESAAADIFTLAANTPRETGQFWFQGKKYEW